MQRVVLVSLASQASRASLVKKVPQAVQESKEGQAHLVKLEAGENVAPQALLEQLVLKERGVLLVAVVCLDQVVSLARGALMDQMVNQGPVENLELRVSQAAQDLLDLGVKVVLLGQMDSLDQLDPQVQRASQVLMVGQVRWVHRVCQELQASRVPQDPRENEVQLVGMALEDPQVLEVLQENQDPLVKEGPVVKQVLQENKAHLELLEPLVPLVSRELQACQVPQEVQVLMEK